MASFTALPQNDPKNQSAMRGANAENFNVFFSGHMMRPPIRTIYIHTVAKRSFGPIHRALFPRLRLAGCNAGERFTTCTPIPDPVTEVTINEMDGSRIPKEHDGWRAAIDLLNPTNFSNDPYQGDQNPDFYANRSGQNLIAEGFWPSLHEVPPDAEIRAAEVRRDKHYSYLARESTRLANRSKKDLDEFLQSYPDTYIALDSLNIKTDWHTPPTASMAACPNCGDEIKQGLAFHKSSVTDKLCILDPERAYKAKAITKKELEELIGPL